jgi:hypothetical protein
MYFKKRKISQYTAQYYDSTLVKLNPKQGAYTHSKVRKDLDEHYL